MLFHQSHKVIEFIAQRILTFGYRIVYRSIELGEKDRLLVIMHYGVLIEKSLINNSTFACQK